MSNIKHSPTNFPEFNEPMLPFRVKIRILMLTDNDGSFSKQHKFGLTELIDTLESTTGVFTTIKVTKAHCLAIRR